VEEEYLITKKGSGTYINPNKASYWAKGLSVIGVIIGSGMNITYDRFKGKTLSGILSKASDYNIAINIVTFQNRDVDSIVNELALLGLDGFIWVRPSGNNFQVIKELEVQNIPVVAVENIEGQDINCATTDWEELGHKTGTLLLEKNLRKIAFIGKNELSGAIKGLKKAFESKGLLYDEKMTCECKDSCPALEKDIKEFLKQNPDIEVLWLSDKMQFDIIHILDNMKMLDHFQCIMRKEILPYGNNKTLPLILLDFPYAKAGKIGMKLMAELVAGRKNIKPAKKITYMPEIIVN
jgi:DNA-binding LacI/PurR family transcriptional regulator